MKEFDELLETIRKLRSPDGCPWDRKQTNDSLIAYLFEESNEVADAIINNDKNHLREELGDLLLQILLHSRIAEEENEFNMKDVVYFLNKKLISRHPHVFGDETARDPDDVTRLWEEIKKNERADKKFESVLDKVPVNFYPVLRSYKLQKAASKVGFDWENYNEVFDKIDEEILELKNAIKANDAGDIEDEFGDVMFALINLSRFIDVNPDVALARTNNRFIKRFKYMENKIGESGKNFKDCSIEELEKLWQEAKEKLKIDEK